MYTLAEHAYAMPTRWVFTKVLAYAVCRLCAAPTRKLRGSFWGGPFLPFCGRVRPFGPSFLSFWPFGYSFPSILAFWACSAFISFHFGLLGFHFRSLSSWGCTSLYKYWLWLPPYTIRGHQRLLGHRWNWNQKPTRMPTRSLRRTSAEVD